MAGFSPLARLSPHPHPAPPRARAIWGIAIHQSGEGEVLDAVRRRQDPFDELVRYYEDPDHYAPHYVINYDGAVVQVCDEDQEAYHVGFPAGDHQAFLSGEWTSRLPQQVVDLWRTQWPGVASPAHLFPGPSPNQVYVGVEMLPAVIPLVEPMRPGLRHTLAQHAALAELGAEIGKRRAFPGRWHRTGRLACHEHLNPLRRTTSTPPAGWDPGALRPANDIYFDFEWVRTRLDARTASPQGAN